ncbi:MAG: dihydrodipicolinate synthase family protein [Pseudomonadota bacterium]
MIKGCFPVLCSPFTEAGEIDEAGFLRVIRFVREAGADGCVFPGVASEVDTLTASERRTLMTRLGQELGSAFPFVCGASADTPEEVQTFIDEGARAGATAAMVMAPKGLGHDHAQHRAFFEALRDTPIPIMLQNAPSPIGAGLGPEDVAALAASLPAIRYVKEETLPCGQNLTRIRAAAGAEIDGIFGGAGGRYIVDELVRGSLGTMPAAELTDLHARLVVAFRAGKETEARRLYERSMPLLTFQAVFRMHMTKATLRARGVDISPYVRGAGPRMDPGDEAELNRLLEDIGPELRVAPLKLPTKEPA